MTKQVKMGDNMSFVITKETIVDIKNKPTIRPDTVCDDVFFHEINKYSGAHAYGFGGRYSVEIRRRDNINEAMKKILFSVRSGISHNERLDESIGRGATRSGITNSIDLIHMEFIDRHRNPEGRLFFEPVSIKAIGPAESFAASGLIVLANALISIKTGLAMIRHTDPTRYISPVDSDTIYPADALRLAYTLEHITRLEKLETLPLSRMLDEATVTKANLIIGSTVREKHEIETRVAETRIQVIQLIKDLVGSVVSHGNNLKIDMPSDTKLSLSACLCKFYEELASNEEKDMVSSSSILRLAIANSTGNLAAAWSIWADSKAENEVIVPPLAASTSVLDSLLKSSKSTDLDPFPNLHGECKWEFPHYKLLGVSNNNGRVFMAHLPNAKPGVARGFNGYGSLWIGV